MSSIQITKNAWSKIGEILRKTKNPYGLIYSAKTGGCNGFNFELNLLTEDHHKKITNSKFLNVIKHENINDNQYKVYVDPLSEMYLLGTTINFVNEDFKRNIYESKFIFEVNNDMMTTCGCGISFSPKNI